MRCPKCGGVPYPYVSRTTDKETLDKYTKSAKTQ